MLEEIYILQKSSGITLFFMNLMNGMPHSKQQPELFSGALQGIRLILSECNIGELTEFITNNHRIEIRCNPEIIFVLVAELNEPSHEILESIVDNLTKHFSNKFNKEVRTFFGDIGVFNCFEQDVKNYLKFS